MTKSKQPSNASVPSSWTGQEKKFGDSIKENIDVMVGHRGDPLNKAVTFGDLLDSGIGKLAAGLSSFSGSGQDVELGGGNVGDLPDGQLPIPSIITGLSVSGGLNRVLVDMNWPIYAGHAYVEIWRNTSDDITTAGRVGTTSQGSGLYADPVSSANATYYYWVRAVNRIDDKGPFNDNAGTEVTTAIDVEVVLDLLAEEITSSQLAQSLATPISNLPTDTQAEFTTLQNQINTLSQTAAWASGTVYAVADLVTFSGNLYEALQAHTASSSNDPSGNSSNNSYWKYVGAYTSLASAVAANTSNITEINYINSSSNSAAAVKIAALDATVSDATTGVTATATAVSGLSTRVTVTENEISSASSDITALENSVNNSTTGLSANSTAINGLSSRVTVNENGISSASADITALENSVNDPTTGLSASSTAISGLTSTVSTIDGEVTALSGSLTTLGTTVGGNTTSISQQATSINGLEGQYSVKIDNNGHVAGFGLSNTTTTAGPTSAFIVRADRFAVIDPASTADGLGTTTPTADNVPFVIDSGKTYIRSAAIQDATITNAMIADGTIDGELKVFNIDASSIETGTLDDSKVSIVGVTPSLDIKSSSTGARMQIQQDRISVFDSTNTPRVILGRL